MKLIKKNNPIFNIFFLLSIIEGVIAFVKTILIPSDTKNSILFGFSAIRLIILGIILLIIFFLIAILIKPKKFNLVGLKLIDFYKRHILPINFYRISIYFVLFFLIFIPSYQFGRFAAIHERLQPLIIYVALIIFQALITVQFPNTSFTAFKSKIKISTLIPEIIVIGIIGIIVLFSRITKIGISVDYLFWGGGSVPVLTFHVLFAIWVASFLFYFINKFFKENQRVDIWFSLLLYISAILIWNSYQFNPSFFAPAPVAPNYEYYPYSDAHYYDTTAQSLLVGEGYLNKGWVQKPFYGYLLFLFHLIAGEKYFFVIFLQTCLIAFVPVLFYFLGKKIYSRFFGLTFGIIGIIRELTAYKSTPWIEVVHSKIMMVESVAVLLSVLICYLILDWYYSSKKDLFQIIVIGFFLSLGLMTRGNILFYFFPIITLFLVLPKLKIGRKFLYIIVLLSSSVLIVLPWMTRNWIHTGYFSIESNKFRSVIDTRYLKDDNNQNETNFSSGKDNLVITENDRLEISNQLLEKHSLKDAQFIEKINDVFEILKFSTAHFIHNEYISFFILPNTFVFDDVKTVINENHYFRETWSGEMSYQLIFFSMLNVLIVAIGIGSLFRKLSYVSLFPLTLHLFYNLSNGFARVSGWRYVYVTDWVIIFYYLIGVFSVFHLIQTCLGENLSIFAFFVEKPNQNKKFAGSLSKFITVFLFIFILGMLVPEEFIKSKYFGEIPKDEFFNQVISYDQFSSQEIIDLNLIKENNDLLVVHAKALYPRFYAENEGEPGIGTPWFNSTDFSHLGFTIVGPIRSGVIFPMEKAPIYFPNASEIYVIGKWNYTVEDYPYLDGEFIYFPNSKAIYFSDN